MNSKWNKQRAKDEMKKKEKDYEKKKRVKDEKEKEKESERLRREEKQRTKEEKERKNEERGGGDKLEHRMAEISEGFQSIRKYWEQYRTDSDLKKDEPVQDMFNKG